MFLIALIGKLFVFGQEYPQVEDGGGGKDARMGGSQGIAISVLQDEDEKKGSK